MTAPTLQPRRPVGRPSNCPPEVLRLVVRHRIEGWRLEDICQVLNAADIRTPGGGQHWWPSYVHRLLATRAAQEVMDEYSDEASWPAVSSLSFSATPATLHSESPTDYL